MLIQDLFKRFTFRFLFIDEMLTRYDHLHELLAGRSHSSKQASVARPVVATTTPDCVNGPARKQLVWFITGTSSGFGRRLVRSALLRGDLVIATVRSLKQTEQDDQDPIPPDLRGNLRRIQLDVTEGEESLKAKVDTAARLWGRIDVLVNNAGQGLVGLSEEGGSALFRRTFDVNVFGVVDMTTATLPYLRKSQGSIVNVGSRSAWKTEMQGVGPYSASKAAVHALSETLAVELAPFNIKVLLVAPGAFRTEGIHARPFFTGRPVAAYDGIRETTASRFASIPGTQKGDPARAMEVVVDIVRGEGLAAGKPWPSHLVLGQDAMADVRTKVRKLVDAMEEWEWTGQSVSFR